MQAWPASRQQPARPADLVRFLNEVFTASDRLVERHGLEKIKTPPGSNYMVVSGVPVARQDHAAALLRLGIDMLEKAKQIYDPTGWARQRCFGLHR